MQETKHIRINEKYWDKYSKFIDSDGWRYRYLRKSQSNVISLLNIKENMNFLDIGCGTGWALGKIAEISNGQSSYYGIDLSSAMIFKAQENFKNRKNFHFIKANAESIPLEDNFFDVIICTNSFHHYLHPEKALSEMHRLLKNGGRLYLLDPTSDSIIMKFVDKVIRFFEPEHVKLYSSKEFKQLFNNAGLKYITFEKVKMHQKVQVGEK